MNKTHKSIRRVLALCLSLVLALTPTLSGAVLASSEPELAIVNECPFIYDKDGNLLTNATEIPEGGVKLTKTATAVEDDPYSFDITLTIEAKGVSKPAAAANIVLVLDRSNSMKEKDVLNCGKEEHTHSWRCLTCGKEEHTHSWRCLTCGKEAHTHSRFCRWFGCDKEEHTHTADCYCDKEEHTHTADCYCEKDEHRHDNRCDAVRSAVAADAAKEMVDAFVKSGISANFAVVGFGTQAQTYQNLTPLTAENQSAFKSAINQAMTLNDRDSQGTNMEQGIATAADLLKDKTGEQNFIVVISDGEPTYYGTVNKETGKPSGSGSEMDNETRTHTIATAKAARDAGSTLYGIAFTADIPVMKEIFGEDKYFTTASGAALDSLLATITTSIITSVKGSVSDTMGDSINPNVKPVDGTSVENGVLNWNPGDLSEPKTITYRITLGDNYTGGYVAANKVATLTYNGTVTADFPVPQVSAPLYHVTYQWAEDSQTPSSATLPTDSTYYRLDTNWTAASTYEPVYTEDAYGNVNGCYTFRGWDRTSGTISGDVVVMGKWVYESISVKTHQVIYDWGEPDAVVTKKYTLPTDSKEYVKGQSYSVDSTEYSVVEVTDNLGGITGVWSFSGWTDPNNGTMGDKDVTITGEWTIEKYNKISYVVKYYKDSVEEDNYLGQVKGANDVYPYSNVESLISVNQYKPADTNTLIYANGVIQNSTVIKENGQVINVVYTSERRPVETTTTEPPVTTTEPPVTTTEPPVTTTEPTTTTVPPVTTSEPAETTTEPATTTEPVVTTASSEPAEITAEVPEETHAPVEPVDPDVPDTSDTNHTTLFAALAVLSAMGLLILALNTLNTRKSRKK